MEERDGAVLHRAGRSQRDPRQWRRRRARRRTTSRFYALAGQLEGDPASLKVEEFWDLDRSNARWRKARHQLDRMRKRHAPITRRLDWPPVRRRAGRAGAQPQQIRWSGGWPRSSWCSARGRSPAGCRSVSLFPTFFATFARVRRAARRRQLRRRLCPRPCSRSPSASLISAVPASAIGVAMGLSQARRMARGASLHRPAGGADGGAGPADDLHLRHRPGRQDDLAVGHAGAAGDRPEQLQGGAQREPVVARHVPFVSRQPPAADPQGHPARCQPDDLRRAAARRRAPASSASCWRSC